MTHLETRARSHVIRLKEQIEKHKTYCYTKETDTDSSISSLGLDQFDGNEDSDLNSDSNDETVQTNEISNSYYPLPRLRHKLRHDHAN